MSPPPDIFFFKFSRGSDCKNKQASPSTNERLISSIFRFLLAINTQCAVIDMQIILNDILHDL